MGPEERTRKYVRQKKTLPSSVWGRVGAGARAITTRNIVQVRIRPDAPFQEVFDGDATWSDTKSGPADDLSLFSLESSAREDANRISRLYE